MGRLVILDKRAGDVEIDYGDDGSVAVLDEAKQEFDTRKKQGYIAFRMDPSQPGTGEVVDTFDEKAEEIMMIPPIAGG